MLARRRLLLLCTLLLAPLPARASADAERPTPPSAVSAQAPDIAAEPMSDATAEESAAPTIEADAGPLDARARASERAELLTTLAQVLATGGALPRAIAGIPAPAACRAVGWSDVVQCRRWSGAQLLRWATPPPARA